MDMRANATGIQHLGIPTAQVEQTIAFYEKLGFEAAGIRKNFYEKPMEDAVIMWKR